MMGGRLLCEGQIELVILEIFEELVENPKVISSLCSPLFSSVPSYLSFIFLLSFHPLSRCFSRHFPLLLTLQPSFPVMFLNFSFRRMYRPSDAFAATGSMWTMITLKLTLRVSQVLIDFPPNICKSPFPP